MNNTLENMSSLVYLHSDDYNMLTASNVGVSSDLIFEGFHQYSYNNAMEIITEMDKLFLTCPKYLQKKFKAVRNSFVFAFGPEMIEKTKIL